MAPTISLIINILINSKAINPAKPINLILFIVFRLKSIPKITFEFPFIFIGIKTDISDPFLSLIAALLFTSASFNSFSLYSVLNVSPNFLLSP